MKYHTTVSNIVHALLLLLVVIVTGLIILPFIRSGDLGEAISARVLTRFAGDGDHKLSIGSVDAALFSRVALHDIELIDADGERMLYARRINIGVPAYRLLSTRLFPRELPLFLEDIDATIDDRLVGLLNKLSSQGASQDNGGISSFLISITDARVHYRVGDIDAALDSLRGEIRVHEGTLAAASLTAAYASFALAEGTEARVEHLSWESGPTATNQYGARITLLRPSLEHGGFSFASDEASLFLLSENFARLGELSLTAVLDIADPRLSYRDFFQEGKAAAQEVHVRASFDSGEFKGADAELIAIEAEQGGWRLGLPSIYLEARELDNSWAMNARSESSLSAWHDEELVIVADRPNIDALLMPEADSIRFGAGRIVATDYAALLATDLSRVDLLGSTILSDPYLFAIRNRSTKLLNLESSFLVESITRVPFFERFRSSVALDMEIGGDLSLMNARVELDDAIGSDFPGMLEGEISYRDRAIAMELRQNLGIQASLDHEIDSLQTRLSLRFDNFSPYSIRHVLEALAPPLAELVAPQTSIEGNLSIQGKSDGSSGRGTAEIGIAGLSVEEQRFNLATTLNGRMDEQTWYVDQATVTTEGFRVAYSGSIDRVGLIPEGTIDIREVESGREIVSADFEREEERTYRYRVSSVRTPGSRLDGIITWRDTEVLAADAILTIPGMTYPVNVLFAIAEGKLSLDSDNLGASLDFLSEPGHVTFALSMADLPLPPARGGSMRGQGIVSGRMEADLSLADGLFLIQADGLSLSGLSWGTLEPWSLDFTFDADPTQVRIDRLAYRDDRGTLEGSFELSNGSLFNLLQGNLENAATRVVLEGSEGSFAGAAFFTDADDPSLARGSVSLSRFDVGRFFGMSDPVLLTLDLVGETDLSKRAIGDAAITLSFKEDAKAEAVFHLDEDGLYVTDLHYEAGIFGVHVDEARALFDGTISWDGRFTMASPTTWRDGSSHFSYRAVTEVPAGDTLFSWARGLATPEGLPTLSVTHETGLLFGRIPWESGTHELAFHEGVLTVFPMEGGTIGGSYDFSSGDLQAVATEGFPIPARISGRLTGSHISLDVNDIVFDMRHLNAILLEPIINFESGIMEGNMLVEGPLGDPDYYGTLQGNTVEMTTFWTVGEFLSIKNPVVTVTENLATIAPTHVSSVHSSGRSTSAVAQLEATVERWNFPHYRIDILGIENPISFWLPLYYLDINVEAMVAGTFSIDGTPDEETLYGDVTVSDGMINFGVPEPPSWVTEKVRTSIDMTLRTGRNVSFVYPNEESPILRATLADDQAVALRVTAPSMSTIFSGELALRSGEIYYVQKNFYVTEGAVKFPAIGTSLSSDIMPTLSLRARLREFDPEGNRIDIFLVLQDSPFDNLNPRFESIPLRSTNEILELLGQSIVSPGSVGDSGLQSVVSVASAATDVFSRLGLLQGTTISLGFSTIIREALGLDVFTIRSNLLPNLLFDALPGIVADTTVSPLARYLDNTTMYIGKYILDDFYLQGMLHLRQDTFRGGTSFLANDLRIDTELSVEWTNPLATFSLFTQPEELSVFDLFDTMGFSVTKRFEF